ncbi:hypothetical protein [Chryseobacterium daeguense]|uniref:hypothetical protein n=1 Tax=Chryseobacterium daeguense TaxID=412438 RepID=UPI000403347C|nr:hypothetical protein [Chryseobacterium daeguense]
MKNSILKLIAFSVLPFSIVCFAVYLTGINTDDFYKRFTSPQQNSLILGSSRAASMNPQLIDNIVRKKFPDVRLYNYSFTWAHSPFGPKYLESISKKIKPGTKDGLFIVTVEPSAVMVDKKLPDSPEYYIENDKSVARTSMVSINPNIEYLVESYDFSITNELNKMIRPPKNVIAEVKILDNGKVDGKIVKRIPPEIQKITNARKMEELRTKMEGLKISENRLSYLIKTIKFLKHHGEVIVIRMPINKAPYSIENSVFPDFDRRIATICSHEKINYINYNNTPNSYIWTDEVHLEPASMDRFSKAVAEDIVKNAAAF